MTDSIPMDVHCFNELKRGPMFDELKKYFPAVAKGKSRARKGVIAEAYAAAYKSWRREHQTATGRLPSATPVIQNIPLRTEEGKAVAKAIREKEREEYLAAMGGNAPDYAMLELRIFNSIRTINTELSSFSDEDLYAHYETHDLHTITAALAYEVPVDEVTSAMRNGTKQATWWERYSSNPALTPPDVDPQAYASLRDRLRDLFPDMFRIMRSDLEVAKEEMAKAAAAPTYIPDATPPEPTPIETKVEKNITRGRRDEVKSALARMRLKDLRLIAEWRSVVPFNRHQKRRKAKIGKKVRKVLPKSITLAEAALVV